MKIVTDKMLSENGLSAATWPLCLLKQFSDIVKLETEQNVYGRIEEKVEDLIQLVNLVVFEATE